MIKEHYENIKNKVEVRRNLSELRAEVKNEDALAELRELLLTEGDILFPCLQDEDAKTRKNAVLLLGDVGDQEAVSVIYQAYEAESQLFVKSSYLKALTRYDCTSIKEKMEQRLEELVQVPLEDSNRKHIQEEIRQLQTLVLRMQEQKGHTFSGYKETFELLLTTNQSCQDITADQIKSGEVSVVSAGVHVRTSNLKSILNIRTYREMFFLMKGSKKLQPDPVQIGKAIAQSDLLEILRKCHKSDTPFLFRVEVKSHMDLEERSNFAKKLAFSIEENSGRSLINSTSDYEVEIRLTQNRDGSFFPCFKMLTIPMKRFAYRKNTIASSINPAMAATLVRMAAPYIQERAQILDPFCGVGTMLIERNKFAVARENYGIDIYGEAVEKARENTEAAQMQMNYIHRDFFDFKHQYLFDEIITNMPVRGRKTKEEMDLFYARFFDKADEVLNEEGIIIMYSNETGFAKKQLRLHEQFKLRKECNIRKKEDFNLYIIEKMR